MGCNSCSSNPAENGNETQEPESKERTLERKIHITTALIAIAIGLAMALSGCGIKDDLTRPMDIKQSAK